MFAINNQMNDSSRAPIKPYLHQICGNKIVSKRVPQTPQSGTHLMPFRVNHNQLIPHLSSFGHHLNESVVDKNGLNLSNALSHELKTNSCYKSIESLDVVSTNASMDESFGDNQESTQRWFGWSGGRRLNTRLYNSCPSSPRLDHLSATIDTSIGFAMKCHISFDGLHGKDVMLNADRTHVYRREDNDFATNCYAFIGQELRVGIDLTVEITSIDNSWQMMNQTIPRSTIFGITDCKPSDMKPSDLPDDPHLLIANTNHMWTLVDNFCDKCCLNDKLVFKVDDKGFVSFSHNFNTFSVLFPIPTRSQFQTLWPFFNLIGPIKSVRLVNTSYNSIPSEVQSNANSLKQISKRNLFNKHLYKCINCLSNYADTAFYRCGHKYYCHNCAQIYFSSSKTCPFCYQTIYDLIVIFP